MINAMKHISTIILIILSAIVSSTRVDLLRGAVSITQRSLELDADRVLNRQKELDSIINDVDAGHEEEEIIDNQVMVVHIESRLIDEEHDEQRQLEVMDADKAMHDIGSRVDLDLPQQHHDERKLQDGDCSVTCRDERPVITDSGESLQALIDRCLNDDGTFNGTSCDYEGPINCWDTSRITDMSSAFYNQNDFNESLDCWDTSQVFTMFKMLKKAYAFNQAIGQWNASGVYDMGVMFSGASSFNQLTFDYFIDF